MNNIVFSKGTGKTVDTSKPIVNPKLVAAIAAVQMKGTNENKNRMIEEIVMNATFLAPVLISETPSDEKDVTGGVVPGGASIKFQLIRNTKNESFFPAFTDWYELRKWLKDPEQKTVILTFDDYASIVLGDPNASGMVINPYGGNVPLTRKTIEYLKNEKERRANGGLVEETIGKNEVVRLGDPKVYPREIADALCGCFGENAEVKKAYMRTMLSGEKQSLLIVIDSDSDDMKNIFDAAGKAIVNCLNGMRVSFMQYTDKIAEDALKDTEPFYQADNI